MSKHADTYDLPDWHPDPMVNDAIHRINRHGFAVTAVSDLCDCGSPECVPPDEPFAYTCGACLHGIPELVVYGLDAHFGYRLLTEMVDALHVYDWRKLIAADEPTPTSTLVLPVTLRRMKDTSDLIVANALFPGVSALEVVWRDEPLRRGQSTCVAPSRRRQQARSRKRRAASRARRR